MINLDFPAWPAGTSYPTGLRPAQPPISPLGPAGPAGASYARVFPPRNVLSNLLAAIAVGTTRVPRYGRQWSKYIYIYIFFLVFPRLQSEQTKRRRQNHSRLLFQKLSPMVDSPSPFVDCRKCLSSLLVIYAQVSARRLSLAHKGSVVNGYH